MFVQTEICFLYKNDKTTISFIIIIIITRKNEIIIVALAFGVNEL